MPNAQNKESYARILEDLKSTGAVWVVDYRGLTVKEIQKLRRSIREAEGHMVVYKNTLVKRALAELDMANMDSILEGPSAFVFTGADVVAPVKAVKDFAAENKKLELKGGIMEGEFQDANNALAIASLPNRDQLLGQIACAVVGVASGIAVAIGEMAAGTEEAA